MVGVDTRFSYHSKRKMSRRFALQASHGNTLIRARLVRNFSRIFILCFHWLTGRSRGPCTVIVGGKRGDGRLAKHLETFFAPYAGALGAAHNPFKI